MAGGSVRGGWLSTYVYKGVAVFMGPVRFEATFTARSEGGEATGAFGGVILDDGRLGEATVTGAQSGRSVRFTKTYDGASAGGAAWPVEYEGMLSGDGKTMKGTWRIRVDPALTRGVWEARRMWSAEREDDSLREGGEVEAVAEMAGSGHA